MMISHRNSALIPPVRCAAHAQSEFNAPVRTAKYPREVPPLPWYRRAAPQMLMAGFLPFSAIYIELYYIFASVWGHKARARRPCPLHQPSWSSLHATMMRRRSRSTSARLLLCCMGLLAQCVWCVVLDYGSSLVHLALLLPYAHFMQ
jgi:hypothetical protein